MIDLHSHSTASDGTESPAHVAALADRAGLAALALTDHDTLDGMDAFLAMQPRTRTRLIPGIELSCRFLGREVHLLGLFVDPACPSFREHVQGLALRREERNRSIMERLNALGIPLTQEDVARQAPSGLVSRAHIAHALTAIGAAASPHDAFERWIGEDRAAHVPFRHLSPAEAARWIREAGGVTILAHPGRTFGRAFRWDQAMADLQAMGVQGLEVHYTEHGPEEERYFLGLARELGAARSGGSDFHGFNKPGVLLGTGRGRLHVPDEVLPELEACRTA
jgi:hypothetical protein